MSFAEIMLITVTLLLNGCQNEQIQPDWLKKWLNNPACKSPCFENITPGITTVDEAESILKSSPGVQIISFPDGYGSEQLELGWRNKQRRE